MPGGSHYTKINGWSTNPKDVWTAAKAKAQGCLDDPSPKLTALERAFYVAAKCATSPTSTKAPTGNDSKVNSRSSSCPKKPGKHLP